jgi:plastocyanin
MRHHRPLAVAFAATLTLGLAGLAACGDDDDSSSDTAPPATEAAGDAGATTAPAGTEPAGTEAAAGGDRIVIADFAFDPAELEVAAGTEVTWENVDGVPHRIAADDDSFNSEDLNAGDTFSFTFDAAGEFPYICAIHPSMAGTIVVT